MWDDQWDFFRDAYKVVRFDSRGHGQSSDPSGPWSNFGDVKSLLDHLGLDRPHLVGLSSGGGAALDFAVIYPEATCSLTLIDSAVGGYPDWSAEMRELFRLLQDTAKTQGVDATRELWLNGELFAPALERPELAFRVRRIIGDYRGWHWLNESEEFGPDPMPYHRLDEVKLPTLVIVGERDGLDTRNMADVLAGGIRGARKEVIAGAGHLSNMEAPDSVNRLIADFLDAQEK